LVHESIEKDNSLHLPTNFKYFIVPPKRGIAFNRNKGIEYSKGEIIVFIDDDCWVQEKWLSSLLESFNDNKTLVTTSGTRIPKSNLVGNCISALGFPGGGNLGFEKVWKVSNEGYTNHLAVGNSALNRKVFELVGTFDESMTFGAEDAEISYRLEKAGILIKYVPNAYAYHEARTTLSSFSRWQIRRGRANYYFKKKVGKVGSFIKLRLWSTKNILSENKFNLRLPLILILLSFSFVLQQMGYIYERFKK